MSGFWSLRRRILVAIVTLLVLTVGSTMLVLYEKMKDAAARGDYLSKHMNRCLSYQDAEAGALLVTARALARDHELNIALELQDPDKARQARRRLLKELDATFPVDVFAVFDSYLNVVTVGKNKSILQESSRLFNEVVEGKTMSATVILPDNNAYLMAAVPARRDGKLVGFVVAARKLVRSFNRYSKDSDKRQAKQHQLALFVNNDVVSSTASPEDWKDLAESLDGKHLVEEGDYMATVMRFKDRTFDLHEREMPVLTYHGKQLNAASVLFRVRQSYDTRVASNLYPVVYVGFGGLLGALLIAFLLAGTITRPIRTFTTSLLEIVTGEADLTRRLEVKGNDELAGLAVAINELAEKVSSLVWRIRDSSLRLGQSAQEISHVSLKTLEGARGQVTKIENSTSLTNELSRTIQEIAARASQGAQTAGLGKESVGRSDSGMARIREAVHLSWDKVKELQATVERIGSIAELISKITEENSMLALNASIEAARAGSAGQGFAVVAQQMREQAKRVEKSSREIIENINAIQSITRELVKSMNASRMDVDKGSQLVNITLHHLSELSAIMQETAESVKEQAAASDDIAQMMVDVQRIAHEALEASQQTVAEGSRIRERAQDLATLVGRFKVMELPEEASSGRQLVPLPDADTEA